MSDMTPAVQAARKAAQTILSGDIGTGPVFQEVVMDLVRAFNALDAAGTFGTPKPAPRYTVREYPRGFVVWDGYARRMAAGTWYDDRGQAQSYADVRNESAGK